MTDLAEHVTLALISPRREVRLARPDQSAGHAKPWYYLLFVICFSVCIVHVYMLFKVWRVNLLGGLLNRCTAQVVSLQLYTLSCFIVIIPEGSGLGVKLYSLYVHICTYRLYSVYHPNIPGINGIW